MAADGQPVLEEDLARLMIYPQKTRRWLLALTRCPLDTMPFSFNDSCLRQSDVPDVHSKFGRETREEAKFGGRLVYRVIHARYVACRCLKTS